MLCEALQRDELCLVSAIEAILKLTKAMEKLNATDLKELPSVKTVLLRMKSAQDSATKKTYQGFELLYFERGLTFFEHHYAEYVHSILKCLHDRIKPQGNPDVDLLNHAIKIIAIHGWDKTEDTSFAYEAVTLLISRFTLPLQEAEINIASIQDELDDNYGNICQKVY